MQTDVSMRDASRRKDRLLTLDDLEELERKYEMFGDIGDDIEILLATASAAMWVVEAAKQPVKAFEAMQKDHDEKLGKSFEEASANWNSLLQEPLEFDPLREAMKPFQQTGDKGGAADE